MNATNYVQRVQDDLAQSLRLIVERLELAHREEGSAVAIALIPDARRALARYDRCPRVPARPTQDSQP